MGRPSHVRDAIAQLVRDSARHDWTIEDVVAELDRRGLGADYSSVFRGLSRLADDRVLRRVELDDGKARFEAAGEHHEHIRCEECGVVSAVPGCAVETVIPVVEEQTGFAVSSHRLLFTGRCGACAARAA